MGRTCLEEGGKGKDGAARARTVAKGTGQEAAVKPPGVGNNEDTIPRTSV